MHLRPDAGRFQWRGRVQDAMWCDWLAGGVLVVSCMQGLDRAWAALLK